MARFNPSKPSFVAGELSPTLEGREDIQQYVQGFRQALNGVVLPQGGYTKRPGSVFVGEVRQIQEPE